MASQARSRTRTMPGWPQKYRVATINVRGVVDRFKMVWSYAVPDSAEMVRLCPLRDWRHEQFVNDSMRVPTTTVAVEASVSVFIDLTVPEPAALGLFDRAPESFCCGRPARHCGLYILDDLRCSRWSPKACISATFAALHVPTLNPLHRRAASCLTSAMKECSTVRRTVNVDGSMIDRGRRRVVLD